MTDPTIQQPPQAESPTDPDGPLWGEDPVDDTPDEGAEPTGAPPEDWDQDAHAESYEADSAVDTSPVGDD
jgi:hypothetical protein